MRAEGEGVPVAVFVHAHFSVSAFYAARTRGHKVSPVRQLLFISSHFCRSEAEVGSRVCRLPLSQDQSQVPRGLGSYQAVLWRICFQEHSGCWRNSVPCGLTLGSLCICLLLAGTILCLSGHCIPWLVAMFPLSLRTPVSPLAPSATSLWCLVFLPPELFAFQSHTNLLI